MARAKNNTLNKVRTRRRRIIKLKRTALNIPNIAINIQPQIKQSKIKRTIL